MLRKISQLYLLKHGKVDFTHNHHGKNQHSAVFWWRGETGLNQNTTWPKGNRETRSCMRSGHGKLAGRNVRGRKDSG